MQTNLYKNDLPDNVQFDNILAIDTEAMGLDPARDRLCLLQIYDGEGDCHLVQFDGFKYNCPNANLVHQNGFYKPNRPDIKSEEIELMTSLLKRNT